MVPRRLGIYCPENVQMQQSGHLSAFVFYVSASILIGLHIGNRASTTSQLIMLHSPL